jgi:site-specific DNA recombinase
VRLDSGVPDRVSRMAKEMQQQFRTLAKTATEKASAAPAELQALDERIARLRDRLKAGDVDMEPDEIQVAIDRAETKRREWLEAQPEARQSATAIEALPKAAEAYRRQIALGLDDSPREALKARAILRKLLPNNIRFTPAEDGGLWAEYDVEPAALLGRDRLVAGVGFGFSFPAHDPPRRSTRDRL